MDERDFGTGAPGVEYVLRVRDGAGWRAQLAAMQTYGSLAEAAETLRKASQWQALILSAPFSCDDGEARAWAAYPSQTECQADEDYAPWIVERRVGGEP